MMTIFSILFFVFFLIRLLRWVAIVQQKEYRLDRLISYCKTSEGKKELVRLVPIISDFSRTGLKRPKMTARVLFLLVSYLFLVTFTTWTAITSFNDYLIVIAVQYAAIPLMLMIAILPSSLVKAIVTYRALVVAKTKVEQRKPIIIGITGSYGKTSTKHVLAHLLQSKYTVFTTPSSHNTAYSVAAAINKSYTNQEVMVLEYAAYTKNEIKKLASWFKPTHAVITGLAPQHLELFGSLENIVTAKAELIKALPKEGKVYYFEKDSGAEQIVKKGLENNKHVVIAVAEKQLSIENVKINSKDLGLDIESGDITYQTQLLGLHYVPALALSVAICRDMGIPLVDALEKATQFIPSKNFISSYYLKTGTRVIDDGGTANPAGVKAGLQLLKQIVTKPGRAILLFPGIVDLGEESAMIHQQLATDADVDEIWYTSEIGREAFSQVKSNLLQEKSAIIEALKNTGTKDIILIEGRVPPWLLVEIKKLQQEQSSTSKPIVFNSLGSNYSGAYVSRAQSLLTYTPKNVIFETLTRKLEQYLPSGVVTYFYKGRDAITVALYSLNSSNKVVFIQAFACYAIEEAIVRAGFKPVYVDIEAESLHFSTKMLNKALKEHGTPAAIIVQHTFGFGADIQELRHWCDQHRVWLIEDLAQAFGARDTTGNLLGSSADAVIGSFGRDKIIDAVSGGFLFLPKKHAQHIAGVSLEKNSKLQLVDNDALTLKSAKLSFLQIKKDMLYPLVTAFIRKQSPSFMSKVVMKLMKHLGVITSPLMAPKLVSNLPAEHASLACVMLDTLALQLDHRRAIALAYWQELHSLKKVQVLVTKTEIEHGVNLRFPLLVAQPEKIIEAARREQIYISDRWYRSSVDCSTLKCETIYIKGSTPHAEYLAECIINLPTHQYIADEIVLRLVEIIKKHT